MRNKRFIAMAIASALIIGAVTGCGSTNANSGSNTENTTAESDASVVEKSTTESSSMEATNEVSIEDAGAASSEEVAAKTSSAPEGVTVKGITERNDEMRDISPMELVAEMKAGWNLGNTFDATGSDGLSAETSWGNPKTTKEMIDAVCEKGFDSIRIPITWDKHMGEAPDYTIDSAWLDRVEEVVNFALDDGMYVIINSHHEEEWRIPDNAHIDDVDAQHRALWTQVAERFKDYGDHLVFEGLNEPRVKGGEKEWEGGTEEGRACVNRLNQSFVDVVRATGGNNEKRLLLVTSFASSCIKEAIDGVEIPSDDHIGVSIHAYTPYAFTYHPGESWELFIWDGTHNNEIAQVMNDLQKTFLDKNVPVLLTEYGAMNKDENTVAVEKWVTAYILRARLKGIPCFWWDNGIYNQQGEKFAIFDRKNLKWYREEVVDALIKESYAE